MIYEHYSLAPWSEERWPNFSAKELACSRTGEFYMWPMVIDFLQRTRADLNRPLHINSAHRSVFHNNLCGGAVRSQHLKLAFDISLHGLEPGNLLGAAKAAKFSSFGFYGTFLHCDTRPGRRWFSKEGKKRWSGLVA
tara:strand:- start:659 stop:1069 length:411 start_codon:yes stop_codon:yes gene_type:complete